MKCWKIFEIKVEMSGEKIAAPEGTWVLVGGMEMPATIQLESINFAVEKLSRMQMLHKGKNKKNNQVTIKR